MEHEFLEKSGGRVVANKWIEIISVRLGSSDRGQEVQSVFKQLQATLVESEDCERAAELFLNSKNKTDWSIYLYWQQPFQDPVKTMVGISIAEAFNSLGLVNHSCWIRDGAG